MAAKDSNHRFQIRLSRVHGSPTSFARNAYRFRHENYWETTDNVSARNHNGIDTNARTKE